MLYILFFCIDLINSKGPLKPDIICFYAHFFACNGMCKFKHICVKANSFGGRASVESIAHDRHFCGRQMHTNLMSAPRKRSAFNQCTTSADFFYAKISAAFLPFSLTYPAPFCSSAFWTDSVHVKIHGKALTFFYRNAFLKLAEGKISFLSRMFFKHPVQGRIYRSAF